MNVNAKLTKCYEKKANRVLTTFFQVNVSLTDRIERAGQNRRGLPSGMPLFE